MTGLSVPTTNTYFAKVKNEPSSVSINTVFDFEDFVMLISSILPNSPVCLPPVINANEPTSNLIESDTFCSGTFNNNTSLVL